MGLMDVLNGMQNGPRGQQDQSAQGGGMSPITMAVLGVLAYKAIQHFSGQPEAQAQTTTPGAERGTTASTGGGDLGSLIKNSLGSLFGQNQSTSAGGGGRGDALQGGLGGLGGLLAGGAAGSVLSGGLNDLLKQFQQSGHGDVAKSWVDTGPNKAISPDDLAHALGSEEIATLMTQTGLSRDELLAGLSERLPEVVNHLTPEGRPPTDQEMARSI